ncbi:MAG TPA: glycosyltransferase family 4 protein, partial [Terriglobia bacterium]|nr:glycosyltransferase family 4 protein [Terriglobia bacterium]
RRADVLFLHDSLYLANILAYCAAKLRGTPIIIVQYTRSVPTGTVLMDLAIKAATVLVTNPMLSHAERVIFIGNIVMASYSRLRFKTPPELIYCGINTSLFHPRSESETASALRSKHGLPEERAIILYVGRFVRKKGLHAIKRMAELRPDYAWVLAGWGPIDPAKWGLDNVIVLSGLEDASIGELYRCSDLFILPSVGEGGFPLVAREALVSGLPVVCGEEARGADPGFEELATWAKVFVGDDEGTAREFLRAIDHVLESDTEKSKMAERQAFAVSQFSWDVAIERYLEVLSCLVPPEESEAVEGESLAGKGRR